MKTIARITIKTLFVLGLANVLIRLWYWSQYDMDVYNMFSDLMNHGKDVVAVGNAATSLIVCTCFLVSTAAVWAATRLWRRIRQLPANRPRALRRTSG